MDKYGNYKFEVEILGFTRAGFAKISGLGDETEIIDYREGGDNESPQKFVGQTTFENVTFSRGISSDDDFVNWRRQVYDPSRIDGFQGGSDYKKTVTVYLKDKEGNRVKYWTLEQAWPASTKVEDLDADGNEILFQEMVLTHEGLQGPFQMV